MKLMLLLLILNLGDLTPKNVYEYCVEIDILYPEIVTAQAIQETGWFKCDKCSLSKNNIFGFYYKKKYVEFDDWKDCVDYYKRWQDKRYNSERDYYDFLSCLWKGSKGDCKSYADDPLLYESHVKSLVSKHSEFWKSN